MRKKTSHNPQGTGHKITNIVFCGIGGQGVLKAAEVCGWAALFDGYNVKKTEVQGMAQRGGSVESHLRFGKQVYSPLVPWGTGDFLVCLNSEEHKRLQGVLKPRGTDLFSYVVKAREIVGEKELFVNSLVLGVLSRHLPIKESSWMLAWEQIFSSKNYAQNVKFFRQGRELTGQGCPGARVFIKKRPL